MKWWYQNKTSAQVETSKTETETETKTDAFNANTSESMKVSGSPNDAVSNVKATSSDPATESNDAIESSALPTLPHNKPSPSFNEADAETKPTQSDKSETTPFVFNSDSSTKESCTKRKGIAFTFDFSKSSSATSTTNSSDPSEAGLLSKQKKRTTISSIPIVASKVDTISNTFKLGNCSH